MDPINRKIYMLWLGDEELNGDRLRAIINMPSNMVLITKTNLKDYILKDSPLHPAYEFLSTIHNSDYMRCYLMHHYGGGYSDIKLTNIIWEDMFDKIDNQENILMMGVKTTYGHTYSGIEEWTENMKNNILQNMDKMICMGIMICRSNSCITREWYDELHRKLDSYLMSLKANPAKFTRECFHPVLGIALEKPEWEGLTDYKSGYPISWNILLSQILYPIQFKYMENIDTHTLNLNLNFWK